MVGVALLKHGQDREDMDQRVQACQAGFLPEPRREDAAVHKIENPVDQTEPGVQDRT